MSESAAEPPAEAGARRRGRPRLSAAGDSRGRIVAAAEKEFAARGYDATSMRAVARRAGVDAALVHHYFDDKADLFAEVIAAPLRPDRAIKAVLAGPRDAIGVNIVRFLLEEFEKPAVRARGTALIRSVVGSDGTSLLRDFLVREVFRRIAAALDAPDADLRANLAASQIVGIMLTRYVLRLEPLASAPIDDLVARVGPAVQWHLTGYPLDGAVSAGE
ncbi:TetR family transcriptional regulator [Leifsonia sp. YIM 134122]|uniref:TetR family transcriptional regulator n=1 Tax=Leifsonia stereocauli TaxID=3134136 RepID=A0ABU9W278_9MICO